MSGLSNGYSGEFRPDAKFLDFSEEMLDRWMRVSGKEISRMDAVWYSLVEQNYGHEKALELEREFWRRYAWFEVTCIAEALNIKTKKGNVADVFKCFQFDAYGRGCMPEVKFHLDSYNDGVFDVVQCLPLENFLRLGYSNDVIKWFCQVIDGVEIEKYSKVINPAIRIVPLYYPPGKPGEESVGCKTRFILDQPVSIRETGTEINTGDYSGEFKHEKKFREFSEGTLTRLMIGYGKQTMGMDGIWHTLVSERYGESKAWDLEREVWRFLNSRRARWVQEGFGIEGNDVAAVLKAWQFGPLGRGICPGVEMELKDSNHGVITIKRCLPLEYFERHNYPAETIRIIFHEFVAEILENYIQAFNPAMKVSILFMPPRTPEDRLAMKFELKLQE